MIWGVGCIAGEGVCPKNMTQEPTSWGLHGRKDWGIALNMTCRGEARRGKSS
jgi:hypothetical protein